MAINFNKNSFDNADSSFQGLGNLFNTFQLGSGIDGCTDPTQFNYNQNATVDDGSCVAFVYGCIDPSAYNYDCTTPVVGVPSPTGSCNDGVNVDNGSCIYPGCMDPAYAEYNPMANQDDGSCVTLLSYGCTDISTATIGDGSGFAYLTYTNGSSSFSNSCDGTNVPCVPNLSGVIPPVGTANCCCVPTIVGCIVGAALNYDPTANTQPEPGSTLECIYPTYGCTDSQADNFGPLVNTDNGTCVYSGCADALADNSTYFNHPNPGNFYTNPIIATVDDGSCTYTVNPGCTDDGTYTGFSATNYDPTATINDGSCEYNGCTYLDIQFTNNGVLLNPDATAGYYVTSFTSQMLENFTTGTADNYGIALNNPNQFTEDQSCTFYGCADNGACTIATCGYDSPYPGAAAVNYDPPVAHPAWPGAGIIDSGGICTYNHGCTDDSSGNNWWPDVNGNDRNGNPCAGYNYLTSTTDCANGYNVINYDPTAAVDYGCQLPIPGCTDATASNYDASATHDDGTCSPCAAGIIGCMDALANNYDPCASINNSTSCTFDGCNEPWADNRGCSQAYNPTATAPCGEDVTVNIAGFCFKMGCTDDTATNYDAYATIDDSSCLYNALQLGDIAKGGTVVYVDGSGGGIVASMLPAVDKYWSATNSSTSTSNAVGGGQSNTDNIISTNGVDADQAASYCDNLSVAMGGIAYNDWYLPSLNELALLSDGSGQLYTTINGGVALNMGDALWSSSQYTTNSGWTHNVAGNAAAPQNKSSNRKVIAFRSF